MIQLFHYRMQYYNAISIGNYVSGPLPASFLEECEISEIHGPIWGKCPHQHFEKSKFQ